MAFEYKEVLPGVWHIQDALGVCMTLLVWAGGCGGLRGQLDRPAVDCHPDPCPS